MPIEPGRTLHGFTITDVIPLPELNITLIRLRHARTGARYVHLANEDPNNLFAVGFRTPPADSTGVAHILEHTALCGSQRYPVRDPFFSMLKRSLNTFMNAMTSSDWTFYPFSSQNEKDYYNLAAIYLDAVFFPLLRERDFRQEGHRLEFAEAENPASPLVFKGVVYNEMKGAMAAPSSLLSRRLGRALYPTTTYHHNSGGEPVDIPNLSWEELKQFHARYYHPSNAWFYTYGNLPLEKHLETIEKLALREFDACPVDSEVPPEIRLESPRRLVETFPLDPGEPSAGKSMVQTAWLTCDVTDSFERLALNLLSALLLGNPAAPLHKALLDSKLGSNLAPGTGYQDENRTTYFAAGLQGTEPERCEEIERLILDTLEETARNGFAPERIEAAIHRLEFAHREVSGDHYPYPLGLLMRLVGPWLHGDDPVTPLRLEENLARLRAEIAAGPFFESLIRRHLLDNPHRVTLTLRPDPAQGAREEQATAERLARIKASLDEAQKRRLVEQGLELKTAQEARDDLSCLPTLQRADIPPDEPEVPSTGSREAGLEVRWFGQPTNGIGYFTAHLPVDGLPEELLPCLPLFCALLTQIGAAGHSYLAMAERMEAGTGGIQAGTEILEDPQSLDHFQAVIEIKGKALVRNQEKLFGLLADLCSAPDFTDLTRLHTVINQVKANLDNSIPGSGHSYAARAAAARLTPAGRLRETWSGLQLIRFVRQLAGRPADELGPLAEKLQEIARRLFARERLACAVTGEERHFAPVREALGPYLSGLPTAEAAAAVRSPFTPAAVRLGWASSVPVAYVTRVFRTVPFTHPDTPPLLILAKLLRAGFLHREIREKGGAYGGLASCNPEAGTFSLLSYRDPQLAPTLRVYDAAAQWAASGAFTDEEIDEAVLAVFSDLDRPLSPAGRGHREFANTRQGLTRQMRQALREGVLAATREDLQRVAQHYLIEGREESAVSVIASEEALHKANTELGEERLAVERI
jgi:Zn-dependent M16 (insulinase) family peptidase